MLKMGGLSLPDRGNRTISRTPSKSTPDDLFHARQSSVRLFSNPLKGAGTTTMDMTQAPRPSPPFNRKCSTWGGSRVCSWKPLLCRCPVPLEPRLWSLPTRRSGWSGGRGRGRDPGTVSASGRPAGLALRIAAAPGGSSSSGNTRLDISSNHRVYLSGTEQYTNVIIRDSECGSISTFLNSIVVYIQTSISGAD
jgi:hypothetical protein